jgi:phthalate 4,5-cis-dihydrodiol dehydrogenase
MPEVELRAVVGDDEPACARLLRGRPSVRVHPTVEALLSDADIEAVWICGELADRCRHAVAAMRRGKHVVVEKPMAASLAEADAMIEAAEAHGVKLLAGHTTYTYQIAIRAMRKIVLSGMLGRPRAVFVWSYSDWMLRPRDAEEFDVRRGGGLLRRQFPHQLETVRLLSPTPLRTIRCATGRWMHERAGFAHYTAQLQFEDGTVAVLVHDGSGYFTTLELFPDAARRWMYTDDDRRALRRELRTGVGGEQRALARETVFHPASENDDKPWTPVDLGMLILSCDGGDLRHSARGLYVYDAGGRREVDLRDVVRDRLRGESDLGGGGTLEALLELDRAIRNGTPVFHDGAWGRASLEAMLGAIASSEDHREVVLERQVAMPEAFDSDLVIPSLSPRMNAERGAPSRG